jgi:hypothetical protein
MTRSIWKGRKILKEKKCSSFLLHLGKAATRRRRWLPPPQVGKTQYTEPATENEPTLWRRIMRRDKPDGLWRKVRLSYFSLIQCDPASLSSGEKKNPKKVPSQTNQTSTCVKPSSFHFIYYKLVVLLIFSKKKACLGLMGIINSIVFFRRNYYMVIIGCLFINNTVERRSFYSKVIMKKQKR